jgi:cyclopropane fatty-acyl-phospholipid synthase-like methyltransferase
MKWLGLPSRRRAVFTGGETRFLSDASAGATTQKTRAADFRERFLAWWNGHEVDAGADPKFKLPSGGPDHGVRYDAERPRWETARLRIAQEVWGEGFSSPGGEEHILNMVKFFALNPSMSVLDLGAGLGGAARTMSQHFGVWVSGLEADKDLAEAGMAISTKSGMGKKAVIEHFDPEDLQVKQKSIDCVFSKEFFYTIADKPAFLRAVENVMKPRGQLLFTDYVLAGRALNSKPIQDWTNFEPNTPHPWAVDDYKEALTALHLDIRVVEDHTDQFYSMVTKAWAQFIKVLKKRGVADEEGAALVDEVELWARRMKAVESGDLKICRVHALKRDTNRLMSSW